jgi:S-DNA-T family DNA segregation ATPase FtsK/SpoIIIE
MDGKAHRRIIIGLTCLAVAAFLLVSLVTHDAREGPFPDYGVGLPSGNACGVAGAYVSAHALALLGWVSYLVAAAAAVAGVIVLFRLHVSGLWIRATGLVLLAAVLPVVLAVANSGPLSRAGSYSAGPGVAGGMVGVLFAGVLYRAVGSSGTAILLLFGGAVGAFLLGGGELVALWERAGAAVSRWRRRGQSRARLREPAPVPAGAAETLPASAAAPETFVAGLEERPAPAPRIPDEDADEDEEEARLGQAELPLPEVVTRYTRPPQEDRDEDEGDDGEQEADLDIFDGAEGDDGAEYTLPPVTLLNEFASPPAGEDEADILEKGRLLERTLAEFRVEARVVRVRRGPVITMYELSLAPGTKVSKVESLSDDLAIALKAPNVRIVAPLPGKNTVGIEVPNTERELVGVRELMEEVGKKAANMAIPLFLGKDTAGNPLVLDLAACPHLLVAGATGSGKSVAVNAMISSILMTRTPRQVQLLLVDPKSVEFSLYTQLPHLICPILSDMKKAASVLKWACKKMDERYSLLSSVGVRDIKSYNELGEEEITRRLDPDGDAIIDDVPFYMPHIVIIIDEFGELMMVAAKEVESSVIRLSQKARAVGIHLICATQRPSADVITGLIKSNLPARIAFQVAAMVDSRTILDRNGAELLLGRGDMLLLPPGTSRLVRAQGSYVSEAEIMQVVGFLEAQGGPQFRAELREYHAQQEGAEGSDDLYEDAVRVVLETQRGSVSLLQRRLAVGYSRAARLVDMMAEAGIVGAYRGSQARRVLMSLEEWDKAHAAQG